MKCYIGGCGQNPVTLTKTNSLATSGSRSSDLAEVLKNWCVDDPDWAGDLSAKNWKGSSGMSFWIPTTC